MSVGPDLEKPYHDAAMREEELDGYIQKATDDLLFRLKELQEAQSFVNDWCDNPASNLALLLTIICTPQTAEDMKKKLIDAMSSIIMPYCNDKGEKDMREDDGSDDFEKDD